MKTQTVCATVLIYHMLNANANIFSGKLNVKLCVLHLGMPMQNGKNLHMDLGKGDIANR